MRQRLTAEMRKTAILQQSKRLFARKGLHGVTVDVIARACKMSPAILYQHFVSKEALYKAVLDQIACSRDAYVDAILSGPDEFGPVLYRTMLVYVTSRIKDVDAVRIELRSIIDGDSVSETFFKNQWRGFTEYIEASVDELVKGRVIPVIDARIAALCYVGMLRELIIARALGVGDACLDRPLEGVVKDIHTSFLRLLGLPSIMGTLESHETPPHIGPQ
ncbi:MAG: TetR/AcrR family transcriptional regulator [Acidiferrobacter sp.]